MQITDEILGAFLDGELDADQSALVRDTLQREPALQARLQRLNELNLAIGDAFPLPASANDPLAEKILAATMPAPSTGVLRWLPRRQWGSAAAAIAAGICAGVVGTALFFNAARPVSGDGDGKLVFASLNQTLDTQLSGQTDAVTGIRIALSFRTKDGIVCRQFEAPDGEGVSCKDKNGWRLVAFDGTAPHRTGTQAYVTAGASSVVDDLMDALGAGDPLDQGQEKTLIQKRWLD